MISKTIIRHPQNSSNPAVSRVFSNPADQTGFSEIPERVRDYRSLGWTTFNTLPMPSTSDEAWRRTDLRGLKLESFQLPDLTRNNKFKNPPQEMMIHATSDESGGRVILVPGSENVINLNQEYKNKGVIFDSINSVENQYPGVLEKIIGKIVNSNEDKFTGLAAALKTDGIILFVPKGIHVEKPLQSLFWGSGDSLAFFSHIIIWVEDGASVTLVHEMASTKGSNGQILHSGIVEIFVGEGANLQFIELQSWGENTWNFSRERAKVNKNGNLEWVFGAMGSRVTKNFSDIDLIGEGATAKMSGYYFTNGSQHMDHDTQQNHLAPNTVSDLLFKGALKDSSRSVWQGMIYVAPGARNSDGYQANRNLTLSSKARADSIPGLEILNDDVRCTHGATVGKIDPDQLFYLQSRGIPIAEAEKLIVEGFFDPIMQRIPLENIQSRFKDEIIQKMG